MRKLKENVPLVLTHGAHGVNVEAIVEVFDPDLEKPILGLGLGFGSAEG